MTFDVEALKSALELLVFGWGGVFLVLFVLYLVCKGLLKLFPSKPKKD